MLKPFVALILIPLSLLFWICTYFLNLYRDDVDQISPLRFLSAIVIPVFIAHWGLKRNSLVKSGALVGYVVGFVLIVSSLCFFSALLVFFIAGSKVTKFRGNQKKKFEEDFKEGGQRNWVQVLCNGGVAAQCAILYLIDVGSSERPIDFNVNYRASWLSCAVLGSLCCSCGDTFASEIGSVMGKSKTSRLVTSFQIVPRGTNGGITMAGTLASGFGGAIIGLAYYLTLLCVTNTDYLLSSPPQWPLIVVGAALGFIGSLIDSILGATVQYSGFDVKKQCVVEHPGPTVEYICGSEILDNHSVNFMASLLTALIAPTVAFQTWSYVR